MPNHVVNELIFRGVSRWDQSRILSQVCNAEGKVDFNILVPAPLNMWWGNSSSIHEKTFRRTHLDWATENWGTKWNAYEHRPLEQTADTLTLRFDTAWGPPYPWLAAVFNGLKVSFDHNWLSEGDNTGRHGVFDYAKMEDLAGDPWREEPAADDLQRRLHVLRWGVESFDDEEEDTPTDGALSRQDAAAVTPRGAEGGAEG